MAAFVNATCKQLDNRTANKPAALIVCSSALRCIELARELRDQQQLSNVELFGKHKKASEQAAILSSRTCGVVVGTPQRIQTLSE
jgi:protein CMS1